MGQTYHALWVHLVWSTKYRQSLIVPSLKFKLYDKFREIAKAKEYHLDFVNGMEDHVHLLVGVKPKHAISDMGKNLKGLTYTWVNDEKLSEEHFHWQDGFAAISVSPNRVPTVRGYIKNQENHHRKTPYDQEWQTIKKRADIFTKS